MKITIAPELKKLPKIDYRTLAELQGDLKYLAPDEASNLLNSITTHGFFVPLFVWVDAEGKPHLIDGHQRVRVLTEASCATYKLPYVQIHADSRAQAAEKLLLVTGQYGKVTRAGWENFMQEFNLESKAIDDLLAKFTYTVPPTDQGFKPKLDPKAGGVGMTQDKLDKAQGKMDSKFATVEKHVECTCPHCGEDFKLSM